MNRLNIFYILLISCLLLFGCELRIANLDSKGEGIICFGNSLTSGTGSTDDNDYPAVLARLLRMEVKNAGKEGKNNPCQNSLII